MFSQRKVKGNHNYLRLGKVMRGAVVGNTVREGAVGFGVRSPVEASIKRRSWWVEEGRQQKNQQRGTPATTTEGFLNLCMGWRVSFQRLPRVCWEGGGGKAIVKSRFWEGEPAKEKK